MRPHEAELASVDARNHAEHRRVWLELIVVYGIVGAALVWNWW